MRSKKAATLGMAEKKFNIVRRLCTEEVFTTLLLIRKVFKAFDNRRFWLSAQGS